MSSDNELFEDEIDPRIKGELDVLNQSTDEINKLETELNEHRAKFKSCLISATHRLEKLTKKFGKSIERARPYYATKLDVAQAHLALQRAVNNFQRANGIHRAAKETIALAESRLGEFEDKKVDMAWQEMLNLQTIRFMEAEKDRSRSEALHAQAAKRYEFLEKKLQSLRKKHKKSTAKTKSYFELKELLEIDLQKKRHKIEGLQRLVDEAKKRYKSSLENLERISTEIHEKRRQKSKTEHEAFQLLGIPRPIEGEESDAVSDDSQTLISSEIFQLDLVGPKSYDDIDELEADLNKFSFEAYESEETDLSSESDDDSVDGLPSETGRHVTGKHLKRINSVPESAVSGRRRKPRVAVRRTGLARAVSVFENASRGADASERPSAERSSGPVHRADDVSYTRKKKGDLPNSSAECEDDRMSSDNNTDEATYRRLHGTTVKHGDEKEENSSKDDEFDIFEELC